MTGEKLIALMEKEVHDEDFLNKGMLKTQLQIILNERKIEDFRRSQHKKLCRPKELKMENTIFMR